MEEKLSRLKALISQREEIDTELSSLLNGGAPVTRRKRRTKEEMAQAETENLG